MREETARILFDNTAVRLEDSATPSHNLSGGQRQAVAIARAVLAADLKVLVMDEPTAALGPDETRNTLELIDNVRDKGISVIVISHNLEHVFAVADRVMVMRGGRKVGQVETATSSGPEVLGMIVGSTEATGAPSSPVQDGRRAAVNTRRIRAGALRNSVAPWSCPRSGGTSTFLAPW